MTEEVKLAQSSSAAERNGGGSSRPFLRRKARFGNASTTQLFYDPTDIAFTQEDMTAKGVSPHLQHKHTH
jgi:hypothetical protein